MPRHAGNQQAGLAIKRNMKRMIFWLSLAITLAACGTNASGSARDSGVTGAVLAGPGCPVHQEPAGGQPDQQRAACEDKPVQADIRVLEVRSGQVVTTIRSSADGRFRIKLPAGQYELQVLRPTDRSASGPPQLVVVQPHAFSQATLQFDTGIR
jgi:hypothetical protein